MAARFGRVHAARLLLHHRADVNAKDCLGTTAAHEALKGAHGDRPKGAHVDRQEVADMLGLLIEHRADVAARKEGVIRMGKKEMRMPAGWRAFMPRSGPTALDMAEGSGMKEAVAILKREGTLFANTAFKAQYRKDKAATCPADFFAAVRSLIHRYAQRNQMAASEADSFFAKLERNATQQAVGEAPKFLAVRVWSSAETLPDFTGKEFCSILNDYLRRDDIEEDVIVIVATHNLFNITGRGKNASPVRWPSNLETTRGGGIAAWARDFYEVGLLFRSPMLLASTATPATSENFLRRTSDEPILWTFVFDPDLKCDHINYVDRTDGTVRGEDEFDFAPYSAFEVLARTWSLNPSWSRPHQVQLRVIADNLQASEYLPIAPWS